MNVFQILGATLLVLFSLVTAVAAFRRRLAWGPALFWIALWSAATAALIAPQLTVVAARLLGIERGADLVFYCGILALLAGFFLIYLRLRRIDQNVTVLVRQLAILEARQDRLGGDGGASG